MFDFFKDYLVPNKDIGFKTKPPLEFEYTDSKDIDWYSATDKVIYFNGKNNITIPKGIFMSNLASIPKPFWGLFPKRGDYDYPAFLHDFLYSIEIRSTLFNRVYSDWIFLQALKSENVNFATRWIMFLSVRIFGKNFWRKK